METKRTLVVDLMGQRLAVRTTESEELLQQNVARVNQVLQLIQKQSGIVDTVRLFALGLLHLGKEIHLMEKSYEALCSEVEQTIAVWTDQIHASTVDEQ